RADRRASLRVLTRLFHDWEHRLASVSNDRTVRPFDWGLDWLPAPPGPGQSPHQAVAAWVDAVMTDTQAFFTPPPAPGFAFEAASADRQAAGESGTVRFPSAFTTPHPENNTVTGRWFPSKAAQA